MKSDKLLMALAFILASGLSSAYAAPSDRAKKVFDFWTADRVANVKPRDLVVDHRGLGYLKDAGGNLTPYGHRIRPEPQMEGKRGGGKGGRRGGKSVDTVKNAAWTAGGAVQTASGRLLYQMGDGPRPYGAGTAATDATSGRSIIITAAHCVYDDEFKVFARNVLFIPDQDGTTGSGTDFDCTNDPLGCWAPEIGVVDDNWTTRAFPDNIPWDYGYYVVSDSGSHSGAGTSGALDVVAGTLPIDFLPPYVDDNDDGAASLDFTHGLGYSYADDPNFMYCAEDMTTEGADSWWLASCLLSSGSSGGPWVQPMDESTGAGPIVSVNSWSYSRGKPGGMGGPFLNSSTAQCLFDEAKVASLDNPDGGVVVDPATCP